MSKGSPKLEDIITFYTNHSNKLPSVKSSSSCSSDESNDLESNYIVSKSKSGKRQASKVSEKSTDSEDEHSKSIINSNNGIVQNENTQRNFKTFPDLNAGETNLKKINESDYTSVSSHDKKKKKMEKIVVNVVESSSSEESTDSVNEKSIVKSGATVSKSKSNPSKGMLKNGSPKLNSSKTNRTFTSEYSSSEESSDDDSLPAKKMKSRPAQIAFVELKKRTVSEKLSKVVENKQSESSLESSSDDSSTTESRSADHGNKKRTTKNESTSGTVVKSPFQNAFEYKVNVLSKAIEAIVPKRIIMESSSSSDDSSENSSNDEKSEKRITDQKSINHTKVSSDESDTESDGKLKTLTTVRGIKAEHVPTKTNMLKSLKLAGFISGGFDKQCVNPTNVKTSKIVENSFENESDGRNGKGKIVIHETTKRKRQLSGTSNDPTEKKIYDSCSKKIYSEPNTPFRRVKTEEVKVDKRLADNSFDAKVLLKINFKYSSC